MNTLADIDLKQLLKICVDPTNKNYQHGWYEFDRRYRKVISGKILSITKNQETIKDATQIVMQRLMTNDFRALKNFRAKESEPTFKGWLAVVSRTAVFALLKSSKEEELDPNVPERPSEPSRENGTHEKFINSLRQALNLTQKSDYNTERDILIFRLRKLNEFKAKEVAQIPLLNIDAGNVDNVVSRLLNELKKNKNDLRDS